MGCGGAPNDSGAIYFSCPMAKVDEDEWGMILLRAENSGICLLLPPFIFPTLYTFKKCPCYRWRWLPETLSIQGPFAEDGGLRAWLVFRLLLTRNTPGRCWKHFWSFLSFLKKNTLLNTWTSWDLLSMFLRILECNLSSWRFHSCNLLGRSHCPCVSPKTLFHG